VARVGLLGSSTEENFAPSVKVLRESLRDLGWVEGQTSRSTPATPASGTTSCPTSPPRS
jgi:hypothetical protein